jgi:tRNA A-37 threonylcarbamoyl transferase component Bud32
VARLEAKAQGRGAEGVPGYVLLGEVGSGGMGVVYRARHVKLNRIVALKMMLGGDRVSRGDLIRFLAEAEAVAAVKHKNVVQVYDYGESDGRPFMALEFCSGGTLSRLIAKGEASIRPASSARDVGELLGQVARGVAAAHALGIVHRDLKPGNVFLDEAGVPKVADFGLAKRGDGSDVTQEGQGMGTPAYMAPEQAQNAKFVGPQADVWALGVMLYEAFTGQRPFQGSVQEILAKAQTADPPALCKLNPSVPRDLELICLKCLSKAAHERYPTAAELADDLDRYSRGEPISVRPVGPFYRAYKWVKRNKVVSGAAATAALALLVGAGLSLGFGLEANKQAAEAKRKQKDADNAAERERGEARRANTEAARADRERDEAIKAKNDLIDSQKQEKRTLAEALFAPLASGGPFLTPQETNALWRITERRRDQLAWMYLEEATRTTLTSQQFANRAEFVFQAVIGLDINRRDEVDRTLLAHLRRRPQTTQTLSLAEAISHWDYMSPALAAEAAGILAPALTRRNLLQNRRLYAEGLSQVASHMEPARAVEMLTDAMKKEAEASIRVYLARGLAGAAQRMEAVSAVAMLTNARDREPAPEVRQEFASGLAGVSTHMDAARSVAMLIGALEKEPNAQAAESLGEGLLRAAARMEPAPAAAALSAALDRTTNSSVGHWLTRGLVAAALRSEATVAAEILTSGLKKKGRIANHVLFALGLSQVAARMEPATAAATLTGALKTATNDSVRGSLIEGLSGVAPHMDPAVAAELLTAVLKKETMPLIQPHLARGLSAVAARMDATTAATVCAAAAKILSARLGQASRTFDDVYLTEALLAVTALMDSITAIESLTAALDKQMHSAAYVPLAKGLAVVAARMGSPITEKVCTDALAKLTAAFDKKKTDGFSARWLAECVCALASGMRPDTAVELLTAALYEETNYEPRLLLAQGLATCSLRMGPQTAEQLCTDAAAKLTAALDRKKNDFQVRASLAACVSALASGMRPAPAAELLTAALDNETNPGVRGGWTRGLIAVAARMEPDPAAAMLASMLDRETEHSARRSLAVGLSTTAARMSSDTAAEMLISALDKETEQPARVVFAQGLSAVAARMEPAVATALLTTAIGKQTDITVQLFLAEGLTAIAGCAGPTHTAAAQVIALCTDIPYQQSIKSSSAKLLAGITLGVPVELNYVTDHVRRPRSNNLAFAAGAFATPHAILPSLPLLHSHFWPQIRPLPPQELVELLKHPLCVGGPRRAVLDALEFTYKRPFQDQWELVRYVEKNKDTVNLDLLTPPNRPSQP